MKYDYEDIPFVLTDDSIDDFFKDYEELEAKLKIAEEALEFYADKDNWMYTSECDYEGRYDTRLMLGDSYLTRLGDRNKICGGKRARKALNAIK